MALLAYNDISHEELEPKVQRTFHLNDAVIIYDAAVKRNSAQIDMAVSMSANPKEVTLTGDGSRVLGKLIVVGTPDSVSLKGTVRVAGVMRFAATGTVNEGDAIVGSATAGKVRSVVPTVLADVANGRGIVTDATDINNIVVELW